MSNRTITIGTRGSELALWQANYIAGELRMRELDVHIKIIKTKGDKIQDLSFDKIEGKGFFTKELQDALLSQEIDLAVHSHKDLETSQPESLCIAAVTQREEAHELLIVKNEYFTGEGPIPLPPQAIIGTSSIRRKMIIGNARPDVSFVDLRGNVPTRIQKLRDQPWHAIVLAKAGINRIAPSLEGLTALALDKTLFVPAPAQGALAIECRASDLWIREALAFLNHPDTAQAVAIERAILKGIGGGCQVPLAANAFALGDEWHVHVAFTNALNEPLQRLHMYHSNPDALAPLILSALNVAPR